MPACEQAFNFFNVRKLNGSYPITERPKPTINGWFSGNFQKLLGQWQNEKFGFRNILVRLHNQVGFSFYNKPYANYVVISKNNYLLDQTYIDAYTGKDFIGELNIKNKVNNFELLQNYLVSQNKKLLLVFAPGKASFYNEYIPDKDLINKSTTNHKVFVEQLAKTNVNFIDFKTWFDKLKTTQPYTLFPKNGIHWSYYGAVLAADSLLKKTSNILGYEVAKPVIEKVEWRKNLFEVDQDVGLGMNLLFGPENDSMPYPVFSFSKVASAKKPKVLMVGDSYCWTFPLLEINKNAFEGLNFVYYNKELNVFDNDVIHLKKINTMEVLAQSDLVIILSTDANLNEFDWNFSSQVLNHLKIQKDAILKETMYNIKNDSNWFKLIQQKAKDKKISVDSMLYLDALYVLENMKK